MKIRIPVPSTPFQWPDRGLGCSASCAISGRDFCRCFWRRTVPLFRWVPGFRLILLAPVAGHAWPFLQPAKGGKAISVSFGVLLGLLPYLRPALLLAAFYLTFSLILIIQPHSLRSIVSFSGFAVAAQISRFLPSVRLGSLLVSLVVCLRHLFSLREHETENAAFTIQSLSAKIRKKQKKE